MLLLLYGKAQHSHSAWYLLLCSGEESHMGLEQQMTSFCLFLFFFFGKNHHIKTPLLFSSPFRPRARDYLFQCKYVQQQNQSLSCLTLTTAMNNLLTATKDLTQHANDVNVNQCFTPQPETKPLQPQILLIIVLTFSTENDPSYSSSAFPSLRSNGRK